MTLNKRTEMGAATDPKTAQECCIPAPPVLEFDQAGNLLNAWGGPGKGYQWPESNHGITVDYKGNVWIGGNGRDDSQILKFTQDGKFLMQFGQSGARRTTGDNGKPAWQADSNDLKNFGRVAKIFVDPAANEAYIADGYLNHRVAVIDADTGKFKRYWGAYGHKPNDTAARTATTPTRHWRSSSATRCTAPSSPMTASSTSATGPTTGSRCSGRTGPS